jgi:uncharacterized membrane protein YukC
MKIISYSTFVKAFKRDAIDLIGEQVPGKLHLVRQDINTFLRKEERRLRRYHAALILNVMTSEEFAKLFKGISKSLALKKLKVAGLSIEQLLELADLLRKLFRAMMITYTQHKTP